jgi:tetratricopeptide (TPR) repeat protein
MKGLTAEAIAEYQKAIALDDDPLPKALLGRVHARTGRKDEALKILEQLRESSTERYISPYNFALIQMGLGRKGEAVQLLEKAYDDRDGYDLAFIKIDPLLDPLRSNSQFEALVQKVFGPK